MTNPLDNSSPNSGPSKKKRWMRRILLLLGPLVVLLGAGYYYLFGERYVKSDNAYVQADKVTVSSEMTGLITSVEVAENQNVKKGDALCTIDDRTYRIALNEAKAHLQEVLADVKMQKASYREKTNSMKLAQADIAFAQKEYNRQSTLDHNRAVAKAQLDDAQHNLEVSEQRKAIIASEIEQILSRLEGNPEIDPTKVAAYKLVETQVAKAELDLERTVIHAPFSGVVSKIPKVGKRLEPGAAVMSLVAESGFWIEANLKETTLAHVEPGQKVAIEVDSYPDHRWSGVVESLSPATGSEYSIIPAQNATGNWVKVVQRVPVRIKVDQSAEQLRIGMSTIISIDTQFHRPLPMIISKLLGKTGTTELALVRQK